MQITSGIKARSDIYFLNSGSFSQIDLAFHCKIVTAVILKII